MSIATTVPQRSQGMSLLSIISLVSGGRGGISTDPASSGVLRLAALELLSKIVEYLPHKQPFTLRSKSALFFQFLLSCCPKLARRLGLDARCDLNCL